MEMGRESDGDGVNPPGLTVPAVEIYLSNRYDLLFNGVKP